METIDGINVTKLKRAELIQLAENQIRAHQSEHNREVWELKQKIKSLEEHFDTMHINRITSAMQGQEKLADAISQVSSNLSHGFRMLNEQHDKFHNKWRAQQKNQALADTYGMSKQRWSMKNNPF